MHRSALYVTDPAEMLLRRAAHPGFLEKRLDLASLTALGIGASVGSGIFVITGVAARAAGPSVPLCFALAGVSCFLSGLCYSELASRFPIAGGIYVYLRCSIGELPALIVVANLIFDYNIGAALLARSFAAYVVRGLPGLFASISSLPISGVLSLSLLAPLLVLLLTALLVLSATHSTRVNNALTVLKLAVVAIVLAAGLPNARAELLRPFAPAGAGGVLATTALLVFAYTGFDAIANAAEEVARPEVLVPAATALCICACAALYAAVSLLLVACVPYEQIDVHSPLLQIFGANGSSSPPWFEALIAVGAAAGIATTLLVGLFAQARVLLGVARDAPIRALRPLARVSAEARTPWAAHVYCGTVAACLSAVLDVQQLAPLLSAGILLSYAAAAAAVLALRMKAAPADEDLPPTTNRSLVSLAVFCPAIVLAVQLTAAAPFGFAWYGAIVLCALSAVPFALLQSYGPAPPSGFAAPLVPALPIAALACQLILLAHLPWQAGARLLAVAALVCLAFALGREPLVDNSALRITLLPGGWVLGGAGGEAVDRGAGLFMAPPVVLAEPEEEPPAGESSVGEPDADAGYAPTQVLAPASSNAAEE